jgi:hypothetical protein
VATLGDLKTRIITETNRDDLVDDMSVALAGIIGKAIDQYANEAWWFNELRLTIPCVSGNAYAPIPPNVRRIDRLRLIIGGVRYPLTVRAWDDIESLYSVPQVGQPTDVALVNGQLYMWPTPNQAYPVIWQAIADVTPVIDFTDDSVSNIWTNDGQDLITAQSKIRLYRDYLSAVATDPRGLQAVAQEADAYAQLRARSNRWMATGKVAAGW